MLRAAVLGATTRWRERLVQSSQQASWLGKFLFNIFHFLSPQYFYSKNHLKQTSKMWNNQTENTHGHKLRVAVNGVRTVFLFMTKFYLVAIFSRYKNETEIIIFFKIYITSKVIIFFQAKRNKIWGYPLIFWLDDIASQK